jgi:tetratricopeptide (TPR) repeat protein
MSGRRNKELRKQAHVLEPAPGSGPGPASARRPRWPWLLALALLAGAAAAWRLHSAPPAGSDLRAIVVPNPRITELEPLVQEIITRARKNLLSSLGSANAWGWYGAVLDAHLFYAEAEPCYRRAHELDPLDVRHSYDLAMVLEALGAEPQRSIELYRLVAQREPQFPPVHVRIGYNLARTGDTQAAVAEYQAALALDPKLWVARRSLGRLYIELGDPARAITELEPVAAAAPEDGPTQAALAQAYCAKGEHALAAAATERARTLPDQLTLPDPLQFQVRAQGRSAVLATERADARAADGDYAGAVEDLKIVLNTRARDPKIHDRLADAYQHLGQKALADQELAEARRLRERK